MPVKLKDFFQSESSKRFGAYLLKAAVVLGLLVLLSRYAPSMPRFAIALVWAVLSIVSAIGIAYHLVIRKVYKQYILKGGGLFARFNGGRFIVLTVAFVVSAVLVAGLVLESPKWDTAEWVMVAATIPVFYAVYAIMQRVIARQYEPLFQTTRAIQWSIPITGALLCLAYLLICLNEPPVQYANATEAFLSANQPFEGSPSVLLLDAGRLVALVDGIIAYGTSEAAEVSFRIYAAWKVALCASAFLGVANLIGMCALSFAELKKVFLPLDAVKHPDSSQSVAKRFVAIACFLPVALTVCFLVADTKYAEIAETEEYTAAESFVRDQVGMLAYMLDGHYYDQQHVQALIEEAQIASDALAHEREEALTPLINAAFDQRVQNVNNYLDWYYSLPADYERLIQWFAGSLESGMEEQLAQRINEGVDETELTEKLEYYLEQSEALEEELQAQLQQYEIDDVPEWLIVSEQTLDPDFLSEPLQANHQFLNETQRFGLSASVGAVAGIISAKVTQKIIAKSFFKKMVAKLAEKLAVQGMLTASGTAIAPGVGTVIGAGVSVATDFLFLKADEAMNREAYRADIVSAIEEQRAVMLEMVQAPA